jgi:hypothetical protein
MIVTDMVHWRCLGGQSSLRSINEVFEFVRWNMEDWEIGC